MAYYDPRFSYNVLAIPLWMPLLTIVVPTVILWRRCRRHPEGHRQTCGYNLAGNTSGRCAECGQAIPTGTG